MKKIALIDCGSGNLRSVHKALETIDDCAVIRVTDHHDLDQCSHIVMPGQGSFLGCLNGLKAQEGLTQALNEHVITKGKAFLGICVGMQLMADYGLEGGRHEGFGWIKGKIIKLAPDHNGSDGHQFKIPHMGWNNLTLKQPHAILDGLALDGLALDGLALDGLEGGAHVYYAHSYHFMAENTEDQIAESHHGQTFSAIVGRDNIVGTQFHPEKSQKIGLQILENFVRWQI